MKKLIKNFFGKSKSKCEIKVMDYLNTSFYELDDGEQVKGFCDFDKFVNGLCDESCTHLRRERVLEDIHNNSANAL